MASLSSVSEQSKELLTNLSGLVLFLLVGGLILYAIAVFLAYTLAPSWLQPMKDALKGAEQMAIGIPASAVAAYAVVTLLLHAFPPDSASGGAISFKAFGLEFSGPAGPTTLWFLCFMAFVVATKLLR